MKGLLGKKIGMTQVFANNGAVVPVTVVEIMPNTVLQVKTTATDGYDSIQIGTIEKKKSNLNKPAEGHAKKAQTTPRQYTKELRLDETTVATYTIGQTLSANLFAVGEIIDVQGTSKGKGFQGTTKRHNQKTGPNSHGSRYHRRPGSMGSIAPQPFKNKALPGQMGGVTVTVQNLEVVLVDLENNALLIKGNIPGAKNSYVVVKSAIKGHAPNDGIELVSYDTPINVIDVETPVAVEETPVVEQVETPVVEKVTAVETPVVEEAVNVETPNGDQDKTETEKA